MRSDKRSKEALNSSAHLSYIDVFVPSEVSLESEGSKQVGHFSPFRYHDLSIQLSPIEDGVVRKFPIILRGDREPWDLGNRYVHYALVSWRLASETVAGRREAPSPCFVDEGDLLSSNLRCLLSPSSTKDGLVHPSILRVARVSLFQWSSVGVMLPP